MVASDGSINSGRTSSQPVLGVRKGLLAGRVTGQRGNGINSDIALLGDTLEPVQRVVVALVVKDNEALDTYNTVKLHPLADVGTWRRKRKVCCISTFVLF